MTEADGEQAHMDIDETAAQPGPGLAYVEATAPYDPQREMDIVRSRLAFRLVWLLIGVIGGAFLLLLTVQWTHLTPSQIQPMLEVMVAPVVALVSAAVGFYFGAHVGQSGRRPTRSRKPLTGPR